LWKEKEEKRAARPLKKPPVCEKRIKRKWKETNEKRKDRIEK
jgi:hypothetical protein